MERLGVQIIQSVVCNMPCLGVNIERFFKMVSKNPSMRQPHCQVYNYVHCLQKYRPLTVVRIDVFSLEWTTQYKMSGLAVMVPESMVGNS